MDERMVEVMDKVAVVSDGSERLNEFVCGNGVVFRLNKIKMSIVRDAWKQLKMPVVPKVYLEDKERWEENPNDPEYREELKIYQANRVDVAFNTAIMLGTTVKFLPEGIAGPGDSDWTEVLDVIGIPIAKTPKARYLQWVRYVATDDDSELGSLAVAIVRFSGGVLESDVKESEDSFRDN